MHDVLRLLNDMSYVVVCLFMDFVFRMFLCRCMMFKFLDVFSFVVVGLFVDFVVCVSNVFACCSSVFECLQCCVYDYSLILL